MERDDESVESFKHDTFPLVRERSAEEVTAGFENYQNGTTKASHTVVKFPEKRTWCSVTMYTLSHK